MLADAGASDLAQRLRAVLPAELCAPGMAYALSKAGVIGLAQRAGVQGGSKGVRVCSISPGVIETPMAALERKSTPGSDEAVAAAPIPRLGAAAEVANVAAFLVSDEASYMTACDILVDGGWVGALKSGGPDSPIARTLTRSRAKS